MDNFRCRFDPDQLHLYAGLIGRDLLEPNRDLDDTSVRGRSVLITGCGGSLGRALLNILVTCAPRRLVLLDQSEENLFRCAEWVAQLGRDTKYAMDVVPVLGSVVESELCAGLIAAGKVDTVFHAAAYKHIGLLERQVQSAIENNVCGTMSLLAACKGTSVSRFVFISTDKACQPVSVLGMTKRLGELLVLSNGVEHQRQHYAIRLGNVLDSSGSVLEVFRGRLAGGLPLMISDPDAERYFVAPHEAGQLLIETASLGRSGLYAIDLGDRTRIGDLARRLAGRPESAQSLVTGLKPGEKLVEQLYAPNEEFVTSVEYVKQLEFAVPGWSEVESEVLRLLDTVSDMPEKIQKQALADCVAACESTADAPKVLEVG